MANGTFDPNKPVPPELLQAMLQLSTAEDEGRDLDKQIAMADSLTKGAMEFNRGPTTALGGAAYALGKGVQGYMGGSMYAKNKSAKDKLREMQRANRGSFFNAAQGAAQPAMPASPATGDGLPIEW